MQLTAARLRELLNYDPETGVFTWRVRLSNRAPAGSRAGRVGGTGYVEIGIDGRKYKAHRLAWLCLYGSWPSNHLDHINGVRTDNRAINLREASIPQNQQNRRRARSDNLSAGIIGVTFHRQSGRWRARITVDGRQNHVGWFASRDAAQAAYVAAKRELHPYSTL